MTLLRRLRPASVLLVASGVVLALLILVAILAPLISPYDYANQNLLERLQPPVFLGGDWDHVLGTDALGRDTLSRLFHAVRISVGIAFLGTLISAVIGIALGIYAAYAKGLAEEVIMALVDAQAAVPFIIIALMLLAFIGNSLLLFIVIMGIAGWEGYARLSRGLVLSAESQGYVVALRSLGSSSGRIYLRHILPNVAGTMITQMTLSFPATMLAETSLSFLGLGIRPPLTSLGEMLGSGRDYLVTAWWLAVIPGSVIFLASLLVSILGDWLRDKPDPTMRN
ncbi:ABC transporter permease [Nitratireductor aquimarinus]|uniref:ABC transporter permease n=1 Tax=Nitratireductor TaxID=245876 RepID=UPI0019D3B777|nr:MULTISPECIES: ABC transporter permease [Nitratireductor]MBN7776424.1 ABC transporter permease [Nitratireductor pacificus]MBN7779291.1 ABC transporter permease [Nitratireductor pacificus]MBN7788098.1 ABC transporter permease [Nitratireductor aquimarinus]MBY6098145.1 ABC transporter permease [Nitratireductor aquimarinus]MCA1259472.1 ABC transporter permease [Nitratireductor aquimarinus]